MTRQLHQEYSIYTSGGQYMRFQIYASLQNELVSAITRCENISATVPGGRRSKAYFVPTKLLSRCHKSITQTPHGVSVCQPSMPRYGKCSIELQSESKQRDINHLRSYYICSISLTYYGMW